MRVSVPSSTCTPHISIWGAMCHAPSTAAGSSACRLLLYRLSRRVRFSCRNPRVPCWRLHICVRSRAFGQNSSSHRSLRSNWLSIQQVSSTSQTRQSQHLPFVRGVQPPCWLMMILSARGVRRGSPQPLARDCGRRDNEREKHRVAHLTSTFLKQISTPHAKWAS